MLFDGWGDDSYGIVRTEVLRRTPLHGSYHLADRTFTTELALHGPFYQVPDWLYFRRDAPVRTLTIRDRCAYMDPHRANRWRYPVARLYGEYAWAYISDDPAGAAVGRRTAGVLRPSGALGGGRALPVARPRPHRATMGNRPPDERESGRLPAISIAALVAGQEEESAVSVSRPAIGAAAGDRSVGGIFGGLGGGNIGNDASMEAVLRYLSNDQPGRHRRHHDLAPGGGEGQIRRPGRSAWDGSRQQASGSAAIVMKAARQGHRHAADSVLGPPPRRGDRARNGGARDDPPAAAVGFPVHDVRALRCREGSSGRRSHWSAWERT